MQCGADPSFVVGGTVPQLGGGSHSGAGSAFVAEACEFDRSFHHLQPRVAIITNIEEDHLDCYKDIHEIVASFKQFASLVPADGLISVTPKKVDSGVVSPYLVEKIQPGELVRLGEIEGVFILPDPLPAKMLFISAGSGITPIMSMLRSLDSRNEMGDVLHIHSARTREQVMFLDVLEELEKRHAGMKLDLRLTGDRGRLKPSDLDEVCPDWREREAFCSGPEEMLDALVEHWENNGDPDRLHFERFQPKIGGDAGDGEGGEVRFLKSD